MPPRPSAAETSSSGRKGGRGGGRGRGRIAFAERVASRAAAAAPPPSDNREASAPSSATFQPTDFELAADQESLDIIRKLYGSRAQTIINLLLSFDSYFAWYYPFKTSVPITASMQEREERALVRWTIAAALSTCRKCLSVCPSTSMAHSSPWCSVQGDTRHPPGWRCMGV